MKKNQLSEYMRKLGAAGGKTTGATKARNPDKMRAAARARWAKAKATK